jgi:hypothetical protein
VRGVADPKDTARRHSQPYLNIAYFVIYLPLTLYIFYTCLMLLKVILLTATTQYLYSPHI